MIKQRVLLTPMYQKSAFHSSLRPRPAHKEIVPSNAEIFLLIQTCNLLSHILRISLFKGTN